MSNWKSTGDKKEEALSRAFNETRVSLYMRFLTRVMSDEEAVETIKSWGYVINNNED